MSVYSKMRDVTGAILDTMIVRDADGAHIPADPANADWQAYRAWRADGNAPEDPPPPSRTSLDAAIRAGCDAGIARAFAASSDGRSLRGSMNLWLGAVLARRLGGDGTQPAAPLSSDDAGCLAMAPKLNDWEGAMFVERDRLIAAGLAPADARWPALPDGAAAFVAACDQG